MVYNTMILWQAVNIPSHAGQETLVRVNPANQTSPPVPETLFRRQPKTFSRGLET